MIENRQILDIFLEPLLLQYARINTTNHGTLNFDINGNFLNDLVSGGRCITKVDGFIGNGILLYTSKSWTIITGDYDVESKIGMQNYYNSFIIPDDETINYKINARVQTIDSFDGSSTALSTPFNINTYAIFKVILNGKEVTDFYAIDNIIGFNTGYNAFGNNLVVIYYRNILPTTSHSCNLYFKQAIKTVPSWTDFSGIKLSGKVSNDVSNSFKIIGSGTNFLTSLKKGYMIRIYGSIYKVQEVVDNSTIFIDEIVPTFTLKDIYLIPAYYIPSVDSDYSLTSNTSFYQKTIRGSNTGIRKQLTSSGSIQLIKWIDLDDSLFSNCDYPYMSNRIINYIDKNSRFRLILINRVTKEMIILSNARLSEKIPMGIASDKNIETLNIEYDKKIILSNSDSIFGSPTEIFGEGLFGGIKILKDGA